jgi:two-component system, NarL family, sensor kinase
VVRREVLRLAIPGVIALALLAAGSLLLAVRVAQQESLRDATVNAQLLARAIIQPRMTQDLTGRDPAALADLDGAVKREVLDTQVVTVRLWSPDGTIVYSDEPRLIGQNFGLGEDEQQILAEGGVAAEVSDLDKPENRYEQGLGELVEVYQPVTTADGDRYLFEVYQRQAAIDDDARRVWFAFAPVLAGSLAVLAVILLTLAGRMARRLEGDRKEREELLKRAIEASDLERRRIAAHLHDGVVQDLAGVSYTLAGLQTRAQSAGDEEAGRRLARAAGQTRTAVGGLRTLLVDIYPPNLVAAGLAAAIADQAGSLGPDVEVEQEIDQTGELAPEVQAALYRVAREALHNIAKHAGARHAWVTLRRREGEVELTVRDDGTGFDGSHVPDGHFGLRLLEDLAESVDGRIDIRSTLGEGTTVDFRLPVKS